MTEGKLNLLTWMVGVNFVLALAIGGLLLKVVAEVGAL